MHKGKLKSVLIGCAALAGIMVMFTSGGPAHAANPVQERCERYVSYGYFENMGQCMQRLGKGRVAFCKYLKDRDYYDRPNARFENQGDCVSWYQSQGH